MEAIHDLFIQYLIEISHLTEKGYKKNKLLFNCLIDLFEKIGSDLDHVYDILNDNQEIINPEFRTQMIDVLSESNLNNNRYEEITKILSKKF